MAIKLKIPKGGKGRFHLGSPLVRAGLAAVIILGTVALGVFGYYYVKYQRLIDKRMSGPVFANSSKIFAAPRVIAAGERSGKDEIAAYLRRAGYTEARTGSESRLGTYQLQSNAIEITPGPESFHDSEGAVIRFEGGNVVRITTANGKQSLGSYELEPQLVTGLFDTQERAKRRLVTFEDIPPSLLNAILAIEDRRFFQHSGVNYFRFIEAALIDLKEGRHAQGGSTLTMQIARGFFLTPEKTIKRKLAEMLIAIELEQRFSKQQIFEFYANQINMGQRGSFAIRGLGEAAQAYFGKDIKNLTLPESALLAAIIQRPSYLSPYRNKERALNRRNLVLRAMAETGAITKDEADKAQATGLDLAPLNVEASDAPYFVDLVKETLLTRYSEEELNEDGLRIYSTIDPELQQAAAEAVAMGLKEVDALVAKQRTRRVKTGTGKNAKYETKVLPGQDAQVALIALDPKTGKVLALVGGRNYGFSQLNHATAKRPTGSIFKPFVFATAINSALTGQQPVFTAATLIDDSPTTFAYEDKIYEPHNFGDEYHGLVTARFALAHSLNNATVKLAEEVGYDQVAELAQQAGIKGVKATPAMALGSYDATLMEMAGAYTAFANLGLRSTPMMITSVRDAKGDVVQNFNLDQKQVMDPRVAYVMTNMMESVINNGTAAGVRARGFTAPAAGKTGTSHDAWFAGYTSNLLCIVWVGYDDYTDLRLEGAKTAAPIWAEFMKRAINLKPYRNVQPFTAPSGVVNLILDKATNRIATATCPDSYPAAFIEGTQPTETCDQSTGIRGFLTGIFGGGAKPLPPPAESNIKTGGSTQSPATSGKADDTAKKKKSFFGKFFGIFKDEKDDSKQNAPTAPPPPQPEENRRP